jgi:hypothetical protein
MSKDRKITPSRAHTATPAAPLPAIQEKTLNRAVVLVLFVLPFVFFWKYLTGSPMLYGTDWLGAGSYAMREFMARYISSHGNIAYWLPAILSGQPTGAAFFADMFYPTLLLRLFLPVHVVWTWTFVIQLFLAGLGTYLFLKELKVAQLPAALGGVAYMFAGSLVTLTYAGHDGRLIGTSLLPLALFFLHRGMTRRQFIYFILMGFIMALQLLSGHIQKVYYTGMILVAYFLFMLIGTLRREKSPRLTFRLLRRALFGDDIGFLVGLGFAFALSAIQYVPIYKNMPYASRGSERGYAYASSWSMPVIETFDLLTPKFSGGLESYWGKNPFKLHSEYLGILPLLFAFIAVFRRWKDRNVKFFTCAFVGTLFMAWGGNTPFYYIPYYLFPGVSKFRGPAMIFFVGALSITVLAGLGINYLLHEFNAGEARKAVRTALIAGAVPLVLLILFATMKDAMMSLLRSGTLPEQQKFQALAANYPNIVTGMLLATVFAAIGVTLAYLLIRRRIKPIVFSVVAAAAMVFDIGLSLNLWNEAKGYIRGVPPPKEYFAPDEAVAFLKQDTTLFRVLPVNYERSDEGILMYHGIQSTGGQLPNPLQSYQDFIGAGQSVMFQPGNLMQPNFMNLANIKYVIGPALPEDASRYDERSRQVIAQLRAYFSQPNFELVSAGQRYDVYRNRTPLPRAFVAPGYEVVRNKDEVTNRLASLDFNPAQTVLLYKEPGFAASHDSFSGGADITGYDCNVITLKTRASAPSLLVLSENYHPDWKAWIDGKPAPVLRAFHTFRAVPLPVGEHQVVFRYDSHYYRAGAMISGLAALFLVGTMVVSWMRPKRRKPGGPREGTPTAKPQ